MGHKTASMLLDVCAGGVHPNENKRLASLVRGEDWAGIGQPAGFVEPVPTTPTPEPALPCRFRARSSVGERSLHTREAVGSNPTAPIPYCSGLAGGSVPPG